MQRIFFVVTLLIIPFLSYAQKPWGVRLDQGISFFFSGTYEASKAYRKPARYLYEFTVYRHFEVHEKLNMQLGLGYNRIGMSEVFGRSFYQYEEPGVERVKRTYDAHHLVLSHNSMFKNEEGLYGSIGTSLLFNFVNTEVRKVFYVNGNVHRRKSASSAFYWGPDMYNFGFLMNVSFGQEIPLNYGNRLAFEPYLKFGLYKHDYYTIVPWTVGLATKLTFRTKQIVDEREEKK